MNSPPKPPTAINSRGHPIEFEQIIQEKSQNFSDRNFVFTAINNFLHLHSRGYFTIIGAPGSGKSAILAKYATDNLNVIYYNAELPGKNRADEFIKYICTQLMEMLRVKSVQSIPDNATEGSWFLSLLLQNISEELQPNQKLIIAIDGLNFIDRNCQPSGTNLFYLPRYLPDGVYFLLSRRPFLKAKSSLLIEAPSQSLDLADYPVQNRQDIQAYIQKHLNLAEKESNLKSWLNHHQIDEQEFKDSLTNLSENNFMYVSEIVSGIAADFYAEQLDYNQLPPQGERI